MMASSDVFFIMISSIPGTMILLRYGADKDQKFTKLRRRLTRQSTKLKFSFALLVHIRQMCAAAKDDIERRLRSMAGGRGNGEPAVSGRQ